MSLRVTLLPALLLALPLVAAAAPLPSLDETAVDRAVARLVERHGETHAERIRRGVRQVAERWWTADGDADAFVAFCESGFIADPAELSATADRLAIALEQVDGHLHEVRRELYRPMELDTGPVLPVDRTLAELDLSAHVDADLFATRTAFLALLNLPAHDLAERLAEGAAWDRTTWARSRLMDRFAARVPADVAQGVSRAAVAADAYIADYNLRMDRLRDGGSEPLFPEGLRLISHWGLRDELKSWYGRPDGLRRQRAIAAAMGRIVRQEIPAAVVDNPELEWDPFTNEVRRHADRSPAPALAAREPDTRYRMILDAAAAQRALDTWTPVAPSPIQRAFELGRQMPEAEVRALLEAVLASEEVAGVADVIRRRLGRELEPFDIWYDGFAARSGVPQERLDAAVAARYTSAGDFERDLPRILTGIGFTPERAAFLAGHIEVDAARGAGHAMGAVRREDRAHLRTRVEPTGMNYKGYNIAVHELGHNVEQTFSLHAIDHWALNGVPNNAFTEAFAFVFQARDLELLGLAAPAEGSADLEALRDLWSAFEIAGVAIVELDVWHWLAGHPDATPAELREATLTAARSVWNRYYAPVLGTRDSDLLAIYSHSVAYPLYLADYPLGHIIAFQVARHLEGKDVATELERMARLGRLTPDAWMRAAVGTPVSAQPLLAAAREALAALSGPPASTSP